MRVHSFDTDIEGAVYESFIDEMLDTQAQFSLTWRDRLTFSEQASRVRTELRHLEVDVTRSLRWPGTVLMKKGTNLATVVKFECAASARDVLVRPGGLFSWIASGFPEDLAFYGADGSCTLSTVAHDKAGWTLTPEMAALVEPFLELHPLEVDEETYHIIRGTFWS